MKRIKLKESDLRKIVQRTINESQLLTEEAPCVGGDNQKCGSCVKMGNDYTRAGGNGNDFINKVCFGEGGRKTDIDTDVLPAPLSPKKQMGESYRRRNYRRY